MSTENESDLSLLLLQADDFIDQGELGKALEVFKRIQSQELSSSLQELVERRIAEIETGLQPPVKSSATWRCPACMREVSPQHVICPFCEIGLIDGTVIDVGDRADEGERVKIQLPGWVLVGIGTTTTLAFLVVLSVTGILQKLIINTEPSVPMVASTEAMTETRLGISKDVPPSATSSPESTPTAKSTPSPTAFPAAWMDDIRFAVAAWRERVELDQLETSALVEARGQVEVLEDQITAMHAAYADENYGLAIKLLEILEGELAPVSLEWRPDRRDNFRLSCDNCETREIDGTIVEDISDDWTMVPIEYPVIPADFNLSIRYKPTGINGGGLAFEFRSTGWQGEGMMYEFGIGACPVANPPDYHCLHKLVPQPYPIHLYLGCNLIKLSYGNWHEMNISAVGNVIEIWEDGFLSCRYKDPNPILFGDLKISGYYLQLESVELTWHQLGSTSP